MGYDSILVGARCAGVPTAMLLARRGYKVLLVDAAPLPTDMPLSTHLIWQAGARLLGRWGLLDEVTKSGCPPVRTCMLDFGPIQLEGEPVPGVANEPRMATGASAAARVASSATNVRHSAEPGAQYPSDVIALVVLWRLRYKLSLRDLPEMFPIRGIVFSYEAVRDWEAKLTPTLAEGLRRRRGKVGRGWYVDESYIKVNGQWRYLFRAVDHDGALVDVMFSEHRDMVAAKAFFRSAKTVTGVRPERVITDGHDSYPRAIRTTLGEGVQHRTSRYLNNRLEQDHRGIKGRYQSMRGFKCPHSAARFCRGYDELRNFLRIRIRPHHRVPANRRRLQFLRRTATVINRLQIA